MFATFGNSVANDQQLASTEFYVHLTANKSRFVQSAMTTFTAVNMTISNWQTWPMSHAEGKAKETLGEPDGSKGWLSRFGGEGLVSLGNQGPASYPTTPTWHVLHS